MGSQIVGRRLPIGSRGKIFRGVTLLVLTLFSCFLLVSCAKTVGVGGIEPPPSSYVGTRWDYYAGEYERLFGRLGVGLSRDFAALNGVSGELASEMAAQVIDSLSVPAYDMLTRASNEDERVRKIELAYSILAREGESELAFKTRLSNVDYYDYMGYTKLLGRTPEKLLESLTSLKRP